MKYLLLILIFIIAIFLDYNAIQSKFNVFTVKKLIEERHITTPEEYSEWISGNIKYVIDDEEHWSTPEETLRSKIGDCEDFAFLSKWVLIELGYEAKVIGIDKIDIKDDGHAITVFIYHNKWCFFDNKILIKTDIENEGEFYSFIRRVYKIDRIKEIRVYENIPSKQTK